MNFEAVDGCECGACIDQREEENALSAQRKNNRFMRSNEFEPGCDCEHCTAAQQRIRGGLRSFSVSDRKYSRGPAKRATSSKVIEFPGKSRLMGETGSLMGETG